MIERGVIMRLFRTRGSTIFVLCLLLVLITLLAILMWPELSSGTGSGSGSAVLVPVEYEQGAEIGLGEELTIRFPAGESSWNDELRIGRLECRERPGQFSHPVRAYDIEFESGRQPAQPVRVTISCAEEIDGGSVDPSNGLLGMQLNDETGEWDILPCRYDPETREMVCYVDHFSGVGYGSGPPSPSPTMMIGATRIQPSALHSIPNLTRAEDILLSQYLLGDSIPAESAMLTGTRVFGEAFDNVSVSTTALQEILGVQGMERFNSISGEIGLLAALTRFTLEVSDPTVTDREARAGLLQSLLSYSVGKWGWQGVQMANIGIYLMNYSLQSFGEAAVNARFNLWWRKYADYNRNVNPQRMDRREWEDFMVLTAMNSAGPDPAAFRNAVNERADLYLNAFFNDDFYNIGGFWFFQGPCPDDVRQEMVDRERLELLPVLDSAVEKVEDRVHHLQERDMLELLNNAAAILNEKIQIRVMVLGDTVGDPRVGNLRVRIPLTMEPHQWDGTTDENGQWWMSLTRYGYFYHGSPKVVELEFEGRTYTQPIVMRSWGFFENVTFLLDAAQDEAVTSITSRPPGAAVSIDGVSTGELTPVEFQGLVEGTHELLLTLDGYEDYRSNFVLDGDADGSIHAVLEQKEEEDQNGTEAHGPERGEGCWVRIDMVSRMPDRVEDPAYGYSRSMSGGSGAVTHIIHRHEFIATTTATWSEPPETLVPGESIELPYAISQTVINPRSDYSDEGTYVGYGDSSPMDTQDPDEISDGDYYASISVSAMTNPDPKSDVAFIVPPEPYARSSVSYYMIRFYVGGGAQFFYIYQWQPADR